MRKQEAEEAVSRAYGRWLTDAEAKKVRKEERFFSHTALSLFQRCPAAYRFRYLEGMKIPPSLPLHIGRKTHDVLKKNNLHKIKKGRDLSMRSFLGALEEEWPKQIDQVDWRAERETKGQAFDSVVGVMRHYRENHAERIKPKHAERAFIVRVPFIMQEHLYGVVDLEEEKAISDYKTTGRTPVSTIDHVANSTQLSMYAMAKRVIDKRLPGRVRLEYLVRTKTPKVISLGGKKTMEDIQRVAYLIARIVEAIKSGDFWPNTEAMMHRPGMCGYWAHCHRVNRLELGRL